MKKPQYQFKPPPKRFQPRGLQILFEDRDLIVANKSVGLLTVKNHHEKKRTAHALLTNYVKKGNARARNNVFTVHRLDRDTSGVIVFAKSHPVMEFLKAEWSTFSKTYAAVVHGHPPEEHGFITSHLAEDKNYVMHAVDDPKKGKLAKTEYRVISHSDHFSLLEIKLHTGRKNQIRVHMADQGCPVAGDEKYGGEAYDKRNRNIRRLALHAAELIIKHPHTKQKLLFEAEIPDLFETLVNASA